MKKPKVALIRCTDYNIENVYNSIKKGIELIGGIEQFCSEGEKILLKPNVIAGKPPEKVATTHPAVFEGIVRILLENKINVYYGDSPGYDSPVSGLKKSGLFDVAKKYNITLGDFDKGKNISFQEGNYAKEFNIVNAVFECDGIISLPKMKAHQLTRITGAVKNQFGCICGFNKALYHVKIPNGENFCKALVDLNNYLKPRLFIMDGIIAMEGNGPSSGDPINMNVIVVSNDPVALDAAFCRMVDINPKYIATNVYGKEYGLGTYVTDDIEYFGDPIENFINKKFRVIRKPVTRKTTLKVFRPIEKIIARRPVINSKLCLKCGICVEECPVDQKAVNFRNGKNSPPNFDYNLCIRCYCCQEVCPHKAINVKTPLLGKFLGI